MPEPQDWTRAPLSTSISSLDAGVSVNAEDRPHGAGEIGILKTSALSGGTFRPIQNKAVLASERALVAEPVRADSILFSRMNTPALVGESCYVAEDWPTLFVPDRIWQLKPRDRDGISMRWLSYVLRSAPARAHIETHATGTSGSMKNLPKSKLLDLDLLFPPVQEQRSIAGVLETLDTTIRHTEAIIEKLKQVKQGLLHDLLTRGVNSNGELRPPRSEAPHLYKESVLGWIPTAWQIKRGREVCDEIVVGIVVRPTQYYRATGVPILRSANVRENGLMLNDLVFMSTKDHQRQRKSTVRPGDVLTVRTGYPGTSCVVDGQVAEANCVDIIISRLGAGTSPHFWAMWINSSFGKEQVLRVQGGLAQQHFNVGDLAALWAAIPALSEQEAIVERVESLNSRLSMEQRSVELCRDVKVGLMDDLLTGRVRVTPLLA
jgi:type I restriction enzyme S subunit